MTHLVTAPLVIVPDSTGSLHYFYEGAVLPEGLDAERVQTLTDEGMLSSSDDDTESDGPPAKSAPKGDWEAYARSQGATDEDLDGVTKDDLVATYGE